MERVQVLIDKLSTQKAANQSPAHLLVTVQLLHQELIKSQEQHFAFGSKKVAVVLPTVYPIQETIQELPVVINEVKEKEVVQQPVAPEPKEEKPLFQQQSFFDVQHPEKTNTAAPPPAKEAYTLKVPVTATSEPIKEDPKPQHNSALPFDIVAETPTLSYRQPQKELHEVIGASEASLNDKLKEDKTELAHVLKDAPIKDLRKGIGVNDKFLFINELFRGDENLYEKSIKTINAFHILPEAEYWINRELKMRLAWNDNKEVVQHFYQLVRRRFS